MTDASSLIKDLDNRIDDILGVINGLHVICQLSDFRSWMAYFHNRNIESLLEGYQFAFSILARRLHNDISQNSSLRLTEDLTFKRADFHGVEIHLLPNSCEKTILLKNIKEKTKRVLTSATWQELEDSISQFGKDVTEPLQQLKLSSALNGKYSLTDINETIRYSTLNETLLFMQDTKRNVPHGYPVPTLNNAMWDDPIEKEEYLRKVFPGYKYTVQFIWFTLTNGKLDNTSIKTLGDTASWPDFDSHFRAIQTEIIDPIESKLGISLDAPLILLNGDVKQTLKPLLDRKPPTPQLNDRQLLEQIFLWYDIQVIDASKCTLFNGVPALIRMIMGSVQFKKANNIPDKTLIVKLVHPDGGGHNYSYAVLVELSGTGDYSGWILFLECCYDYTGTGTSQLRIVEQLLSECRKKGLIEVKEKVIAKEQFLKLMDSYFINFPGQLDLIDTKERLNTGRGLSLELLTYYYFSKKYTKESRVEWNYTHGRIQIDVLANDGNKLILVECKLPTEDLVGEAIQLKKNANILTGVPDFRTEWNVSKDVDKVFFMVVWERPPEETIKQLKSEGISLVVMSEVFHTELSNKNQDRKLDHLFGERNPGIFEEDDLR